MGGEESVKGVADYAGASHRVEVRGWPSRWEISVGKCGESRLVANDATGALSNKSVPGIAICRRRR